MRKLTLVFVLVSKSLVLLLLPLLHHQRLHQLFIFSFLQRNQGSQFDYLLDPRKLKHA